MYVIVTSGKMNFFMLYFLNNNQCLFLLAYIYRITQLIDANIFLLTLVYIFYYYKFWKQKC